MAREKMLEMAAINITIQPHSREKYIQLFRDAYNLEEEFQIRGDSYGIISAMTNLDGKSGTGGLTGDIFKFTNIDKTTSWFNRSTNKFASEEELDRVQIPEHLKPNSSRFSFIFYPDKHLFFYESYTENHTLGPSNAARFLNNLFSHKSLVKKYGKVDITVVPDTDKLTSALQLPIKERLELRIKRPNPDDLESLEAEVLERMTQLNVSDYEEKYKSASGSSIDIDQQLETRTKVAAKNGTVKIKGKDEENRPVEYSTYSHPWKEKKYFDPDITTPFSILRNVSSQMKQVMQTWFN